MAQLAIKGSQDASSNIARHSRALDGAWMLYAQGNILNNTPDAGYRMAKWIVLAGGTYVVRGIGFTSAKITFDGLPEKSGEFDSQVANGYPQFIVQLDGGAHRIDVTYVSPPLKSDDPATPGYVGFALYKGSESSPETVSTPSDWVVTTGAAPDIGDEPHPTPAMNLPVWLLPPNWKDSVTETVEWKTDVLMSESGAEQRRKLRRFPRRFIEAQFVVDAEWQQLADSTIMGVGRQPMLVPIMWDVQRLANPSDKGANEVYGSFANRLDYQPGKLALLIADDVMQYEVVAISGVSDDTLTLAYPLRRQWGTATRIMPLCRGSINDVVANDAVTSAAGTYQIRWQLLDFLNVTPDWGDALINPKSGRRVVHNWGTNWHNTLSFQVDRKVYDHDNDTGVFSSTDVGGNSTQMWSTSLMIHGVADYAAFQRRIHKMCGQYKTFHIPTDVVNLTLLDDIDPSSGAIAVRPTGYTAYGTISQNIRQWLMLRKFDGTTYFSRVISTSIRQGVEYLFLEQTIGAIAMRDIAAICWCPVGRLATDSIEIVHHTDIMGVCEVSLAVVGFYDRRIPSPG